MKKILQRTAHSSSTNATQQLGLAVANMLRGGETIALVGPLGSGKTTFVKGLARGLGVKRIITSPTFVLMKVYRASKGKIRQLVHVDCYRVPGAELNNIGLSDYLGDPHTVTAIEWAEKLSHNLKPTLQLNFRVGKKLNQRILRIKRALE